jgi:hypothetical protein
MYSDKVANFDQNGKYESRVEVTVARLLPTHGLCKSLFLPLCGRISQVNAYA